MIVWGGCLLWWEAEAGLFHMNFQKKSFKKTALGKNPGVTGQPKQNEVRSWRKMRGFLWTQSWLLSSQRLNLCCLFPSSLWISLGVMTKEPRLCVDFLPFYWAVGMNWDSSILLNSPLPARLFSEALKKNTQKFLTHQQPLWDSSPISYQHSKGQLLLPQSSRKWVTQKATGALLLKEPSSGVGGLTSLGKKEGSLCLWILGVFINHPLCAKQNAGRPKELVLPNLLF